MIRVPKEIVWWVLDKKGIPSRYIDLVKDMYDGVIISVRTIGGETREFAITIGLHQGSMLSTYLLS